MYKAKQPPQVNELGAVAAWMYDELKEVERSFLQLDKIRLVKLFAAPGKPRTGDVVLADGTTWDPGSGAGFYGYHSGGWVKLG